MNIRTHRVTRVAYECVAAHREDQDKKKYGALAHKLPSMILANGLAQATGFLIAKGESEHRALLNDLNAVLCATETSTATDGPALHQQVIGSNLSQTLILTRRSLEASGWIKRLRTRCPTRERYRRHIGRKCGRYWRRRARRK